MDVVEEFRNVVEVVFGGVFSDFGVSFVCVVDGFVDAFGRGAWGVVEVHREFRCVGFGEGFVVEAFSDGVLVFFAVECVLALGFGDAEEVGDDVLVVGLGSFPAAVVDEG